MAEISREELAAVEALLSAHPGVRKVHAVLLPSEQNAENNFVVYVVPNQEHIDRSFPEDERRRVKKWGKTFDLSQLGKETSATQAGFNIAGWNSSYTRQPIPAEEMQEWVDLTVDQILALRPTEVLEIGCGTGLLLLRIAGKCKRYVGTDIAPVVLKKLREQMTQLPGVWENVTLVERPAENFEGFSEDEFDTLVLNSVVKYFPNAAYLNRVLESAVRVVRPGGRIFVGDVRNLALLDPYAFSIEFFQASSEMTLAELSERIFRRVDFEEQLVVSPAFFVALQHRLPKISRVEIRPKRGRFDNELTRFRFDAVLHLSQVAQPAIESSWVDWEKLNYSAESIASTLQKDLPEHLAIRAIRNGRVEKDVRGLAALNARPKTGPVGDLQKMISSAELRGIDPYKLFAIAADSNYHLALSWKAARADGSYDAIFFRYGVGRELSSGDFAWPEPNAASQTPAQQTNTPGKAGRREKFVEQLTAHLVQSLSREIPPGTVTLVDEFHLDI